MSLRPVIFWSHLVAGVIAGLVIFVMAATGVLLTYERQVVDLAERWHAEAPVGDANPLDVDGLLAVFRERHPAAHHYWFRFVNRPHAAVTVWAGPENGYLVNPYTAEVVRDAQGGVVAFFHVVTDLHRWLAIEGDGHDAARAITGWSNVLFIFLVLTGIYLWWPPFWRWTVLKSKMLFSRKFRQGRPRDFHWHQVFSFWAFIPLFFITVTATVISFPWANQALYGVFGESVPDHGHDHDEEHLPGHDDDHGGARSESAKLSRQALFERAQAHAARNGARDWYSMWVEFEDFADTPVEFYIDRSIGHRPWLAYELTLDGVSGDVTQFKPLDAYSRGDQARDFVRYLHTGEVYGFAGQTVAGLASLAACFLVWTGLALAWRRLVVRR